MEITIDADSFPDGGLSRTEFALKNGFSVFLINTGRTFIAQINTLAEQLNAKAVWNVAYSKCHLRLRLG